MIIQGLLSLSEASSQDRRKEPSWCPTRTAPAQGGSCQGSALGKDPEEMKSFSDPCPSQEFECNKGICELSECHLQSVGNSYRDAMPYRQLQPLAQHPRTSMDYFLYPRKPTFTSKMGYLLTFVLKHVDCVTRRFFPSITFLPENVS